MESGYQLPISIYDALERIIDNTYLLPAIQRKFVWKSEQIETLFDSIMRDYPINSFMFWKIEDDGIKSGYKFYEFLKNYREFFNDENPYISTKGFKDFYAVIDGQQRLTSLYIGLKGTYAYRLPRRWLRDTEENIPTRELYIDVRKAIPEEKRDERKMVYNFKFLTEDEVKRDSEQSDSIWFRVNDLYLFGENSIKLQRYIISQPWGENDFAVDTILKLHKKVFVEKLITFYLETKQEIDAVLDIFIRTNRGGEPLSYSNLLMSFITANWQRDTRSEFRKLIDQIFEIGRPGFMVDSDFILKTCLVLFCKDIKFRLKNFDSESVGAIEDNWPRITKSIIEAFKLAEKWGFNNSTVRAKNAFIPIIYYIYYNQLEDRVNNPLLCREEKEEMRIWFCISLLKRVFGGQSDSVLVGIRKVLNENLRSGKFPFAEIKYAFKDNPSKNLSFDEEFIDGLLSLHKDDSSSYTVMALIYSHMPFGDRIYHLDHLHPAAFFRSIKKDEKMSEDNYNFYKDSENWDTLPNLQLLNDRVNEHKNDMSLKDWIIADKVDLDYQLIPKDISLDVKDFKEFITKRKALLKERLMGIVQ